VTETQLVTIVGGVGTIAGAVAGWFTKQRAGTRNGNGAGSKEIIAAINNLRETTVAQHERTREHFTTILAAIRAESELTMLKAIATMRQGAA
jgi:hypothetical protein